VGGKMKKTARLQRQEGVQKNRIDRESKILEKKMFFFEAISNAYFLVCYFFSGKNKKTKICQGKVRSKKK